MIVASCNELRSLLKNAFQGAKQPCGDYESMAEAVLWAMVTDRINWQEFPQTLSRIESCKEIDLSADNLSKVNVHGQSLVVHGAPLVDYAIAKALNDGEFCMQIWQATDPVYLDRKLRDAAEQGLFGSLIWCDSSGLNRMQISPSETFTSHHIGEQVADATHVEILLTQQPEAFYERITSHLNLLTSSSQCAERYQSSIENGINVPQDIWLRLAGMAEKILVPNSEQSRLGAGE